MEKILIVGGDAAGLELAIKLGRTMKNGLKTNQLNQIITDNKLRSISDENVYVLEIADVFHG